MAKTENEGGDWRRSTHENGTKAETSLFFHSLYYTSPNIGILQAFASSQGVWEMFKRFSQFIPALSDGVFLRGFNK